MNYLYKPKTEFVICEDINIDYLSESYHMQCPNSLLASFNLTSVVSFPTRIQNSSNSAIDNIFIDSSRLVHISIKSVVTGLSDHDAQLLVIKNINPIPNFHNYKKVTREVNDVTINNRNTAHIPRVTTTYSFSNKIRKPPFASRIKVQDMCCLFIPSNTGSVNVRHTTPLKDPIKPEIYTPILTIYPRLVMPYEEVDKFHVCSSSPPCNGFDIFLF
jgi:hypothetical protein